MTNGGSMSQCVTVTTDHLQQTARCTTPRAFALTQKSFVLEAYVGLELEILRRHCACSSFVMMRDLPAASQISKIEPISKGN